MSMVAAYPCLPAFALPQGRFAAAGDSVLRGTVTDWAVAQRRRVDAPLPPGTYPVTAVRNGFATVRRQVNVVYYTLQAAEPSASTSWSVATW